jgi:ferredoxin
VAKADKFHISFKGKTWAVEAGSNLRSALLKEGMSPHNGAAQWLNCKGLGTCGTCALDIEGDLSPLNAREKWRLNFPPHKEANQLRLACQIKVQSDLQLQKHAGFWGEKKGEVLDKP